MDHQQVYDRIAGRYADQWDGYISDDLQSFTRRVGTGRILDAGCGPGRDLAAFAALGADAIGVDSSPAMIALARTDTQPAVVGDLLALSWPEETFVGTWAAASLVHFDDSDTAAALAELARVTARDGIARVTVKASTGGRGREGWEGDGADARWFRYWDPCEFAAVAAAAGWAVEQIHLEADSARPGLEWVTASLRRPPGA
jgi:SAM-dependent methyltransferase